MADAGRGVRLTVASVAYPFAAVGRNAVGGAEQVLASIDRALVAAGHGSIVIARAESEVAGELVAIPARTGMIDAAARAAAYADVSRAIASVRNRVDIMHVHGIDFASYLPPPGRPVLATLHLPPGWYPVDALAERPGLWLHAVSDDQHRGLLARAGLHGRILPPIPNGVPVEALAARHARRGFALTLGRVCPEKGQHTALAAAHLAGVPLLIGGEVFPYPDHRAYFDTRVAPFLDQRRRFLGPVGFVRKRRLLTAARCLLVPSTAAETSSLVAMEALACGTPVIAFRAGALPSVVEHGRTGFLVDDAPGMAAAIARAGEIDPTACRATARARFSENASTAAYLATYAKLAACA